MEKELKLVIPSKYKSVVSDEILKLNGLTKEESEWSKLPAIPQEFFREAGNHNDTSIACSKLIEYAMDKLNYDGLFNDDLGCQCIRTGLYPCNTFDKYRCRAGYHQKETSGMGWAIGYENFGVKYT